MSERYGDSVYRQVDDRVWLRAGNTAKKRCLGRVWYRVYCQVVDPATDQLWDRVGGSVRLWAQETLDA